jgi:cell division protein FtsB
MLWWGAWALMAVLFFANGGFRLMVQRYFDVKKQRESLALLQAEQNRLRHEWNLIQNDPSHIEYLVRKTLGYAKKDEVEYRLTTQK